MSFLKTYQKSVASFVTVCFITSFFILPPPALAQPTFEKIPLSLAPLGIPPELASIEEVFIPDPKKETGVPLIHIQSVHAHAETQKKIYALLKLLDEKYGIHALYIEGAGEKLNPDYFRFFDDNRLNVRVAEKLVEKGELTGAELFLIESQKKIPAYGLEDPALYRENLTSFEKVMTRRDLTGQFTQETHALLDRLETLLLSPPARKLLRSSEAFDAGQMELLSYALELERMTKEILELDLRYYENQLDWPQMIRLLRLQELESKLEPEKIQSDRQKLTGFLKQLQIDPELVGSFENLSFSSFQSGMVYDPGFRKNDLPRYLAERLVEATMERGFSFDRYPYFTRYLEAAILQSELEAERLFGEMEKLFETLIQRVSSRQEEWKLVGLVHEERLLERLFDLELTPKDYAKVEESNQADRPLVRFLLGIESLHEGTNLGDRKVIPDNIQAIESVYGDALRFYSLAKEREEVMVEKILNPSLRASQSEAKQSQAPEIASSLPAEGTVKGILISPDARGVRASSPSAPRNDNEHGVTILITGGFHTEGLSRQFRKKGIPYTIVSPRITEKVSPEVYISALLGETKTAFDTQYLEVAANSEHSDLLLGMFPKRQSVAMEWSRTTKIIPVTIEVGYETRMPVERFLYEIGDSLFFLDRQLEAKSEARHVEISSRKNGRSMRFSVGTVKRVTETDVLLPSIILEKTYPRSKPSAGMQERKVSGESGGGVSSTAQINRPREPLRQSGMRQLTRQSSFIPPSSWGDRSTSPNQIISQGEGKIPIETLEEGPQKTRRRAELRRGPLKSPEPPSRLRPVDWSQTLISAAPFGLMTLSDILSNVNKNLIKDKSHRAAPALSEAKRSRRAEVRFRIRPIHAVDLLSAVAYAAPFVSFFLGFPLGITGLLFIPAGLATGWIVWRILKYRKWLLGEIRKIDQEGGPSDEITGPKKGKEALPPEVHVAPPLEETAESTDIGEAVKKLNPDKIEDYRTLRAIAWTLAHLVQENPPDKNIAVQMPADLQQEVHAHFAAIQGFSRQGPSRHTKFSGLATALMGAWEDKQLKEWLVFLFSRDPKKKIRNPQLIDLIMKEPFLELDKENQTLKTSLRYVEAIKDEFDELVAGLESQIDQISSTLLSSYLSSQGLQSVKDLDEETKESLKETLQAQTKEILKSSLLVIVFLGYPELLREKFKTHPFVPNLVTEEDILDLETKAGRRTAEETVTIQQTPWGAPLQITGDLGAQYGQLVFSDPRVLSHLDALGKKLGGPLQEVEYFSHETARGWGDHTVNFTTFSKNKERLVLFADPEKFAESPDTSREERISSVAHAIASALAYVTNPEFLRAMDEATKTQAKLTLNPTGDLPIAAPAHELARLVYEIQMIQFIVERGDLEAAAWAARHWIDNLASQEVDVAQQMINLEIKGHRETAHQLGLFLTLTRALILIPFEKEKELQQELRARLEKTELFHNFMRHFDLVLKPSSLQNKDQERAAIEINEFINRHIRQIQPVTLDNLTSLFQHISDYIRYVPRAEVRAGVWKTRVTAWASTLVGGVLGLGEMAGESSRSPAQAPAQKRQVEQKVFSPYLESLYLLQRPPREGFDEKSWRRIRNQITTSRLASIQKEEVPARERAELARGLGKGLETSIRVVWSKMPEFIGGIQKQKGKGAAQGESLEMLEEELAIQRQIAEGLLGLAKTGGPDVIRFASAAFREAIPQAKTNARNFRNYQYPPIADFDPDFSYRNRVYQLMDPFLEDLYRKHGQILALLEKEIARQEQYVKGERAEEKRVYKLIQGLRENKSPIQQEADSLDRIIRDLEKGNEGRRTKIDGLLRDPLGDLKQKDVEVNKLRGQIKTHQAEIDRNFKEKQALSRRLQGFDLQINAALEAAEAAAKSRDRYEETFYFLRLELKWSRRAEIRASTPEPFRPWLAREATSGIYRDSGGKTLEERMGDRELAAELTAEMDKRLTDQFGPAVRYGKVIGGEPRSFEETITVTVGGRRLNFSLEVRPREKDSAVLGYDIALYQDRDRPEKEFVSDWAPEVPTKPLLFRFSLERVQSAHYTSTPVLYYYQSPDRVEKAKVSLELLIDDEYRVYAWVGRWIKTTGNYVWSAEETKLEKKDWRTYVVFDTKRPLPGEEPVKITFVAVSKEKSLKEVNNEISRFQEEFEALQAEDEKDKPEVLMKEREVLIRERNEYFWQEKSYFWRNWPGEDLVIDVQPPHQEEARQIQQKISNLFSHDLSNRLVSLGFVEFLKEENKGQNGGTLNELTKGVEEIAQFVNDFVNPGAIYFQPPSNPNILATERTPVYEAELQRQDGEPLIIYDRDFLAARADFPGIYEVLSEGIGGLQTSLSDLAQGIEDNQWELVERAKQAFLVSWGSLSQFIADYKSKISRAEVRAKAPQRRFRLTRRAWLAVTGLTVGAVGLGVWRYLTSGKTPGQITYFPILHGSAEEARGYIDQLERARRQAQTAGQEFVLVRDFGGPRFPLEVGGVFADDLIDRGRQRPEILAPFREFFDQTMESLRREADQVGQGQMPELEAGNDFIRVLYEWASRTRTRIVLEEISFERWLDDLWVQARLEKAQRLFRTTGFIQEGDRRRYLQYMDEAITRRSHLTRQRNRQMVELVFREQGEGRAIALLYGATHLGVAESLEDRGGQVLRTLSRQDQDRLARRIGINGIAGRLANDEEVPQEERNLIYLRHAVFLSLMVLAHSRGRTDITRNFEMATQVARRWDEGRISALAFFYRISRRDRQEWIDFLDTWFRLFGTDEERSYFRVPPARAEVRSLPPSILEKVNKEVLAGFGSLKSFFKTSDEKWAKFLSERKEAMEKIRDDFLEQEKFAEARERLASMARELRQNTSVLAQEDLGLKPEYSKDTFITEWEAQISRIEELAREVLPLEAQKAYNDYYELAKPHLEPKFKDMTLEEAIRIYVEVVKTYGSPKSEGSEKKSPGRFENDNILIVFQKIGKWTDLLNNRLTPLIGYLDPGMGKLLGESEIEKLVNETGKPVYALHLIKTAVDSGKPETLQKIEGLWKRIKAESEAKPERAEVRLPAARLPDGQGKAGSLLPGRALLPKLRAETRFERGGVRVESGSFGPIPVSASAVVTPQGAFAQPLLLGQLPQALEGRSLRSELRVAIDVSSNVLDAEDIYGSRPVAEYLLQLLKSEVAGTIPLTARIDRALSFAPQTAAGALVQKMQKVMQPAGRLHLFEGVPEEREFLATIWPALATGQVSFEIVLTPGSLASEASQMKLAQLRAEVRRLAPGKVDILTPQTDQELARILGETSRRFARKFSVTDTGSMANLKERIGISVSQSLWEKLRAGSLIEEGIQRFLLADLDNEASLGAGSFVVTAVLLRVLPSHKKSEMRIMAHTYRVKKTDLGDYLDSIGNALVNLRAELQAISASA